MIYKQVYRFTFTQTENVKLVMKPTQNGHAVVWCVQKMKMLADFKNRFSSTTHTPKEGSYYFIYIVDTSKKYRAGVRSLNNWF